MAKPIIACPNCDTLHERQILNQRATAHCSCCGQILYRRGTFTLNQWVALSWTSLIVFFIAQYFPIIHLSIKGLEVHLTYWQALRLSWDREFYLVSIMTGVMGFWFPLVQISLTLWIMQNISKRHLSPDLVFSLRLLNLIAPWSMVSVLVLGIIVALVKIIGIANYNFDYGFPAFIILALILAGLSGWDSKALWRYAEDQGLVMPSGNNGTGVVCHTCACVQKTPDNGKCIRCYASLNSKRYGSNGHVWALIIAATILYFPANLLPIMKIQTLIGNSEHTILGGVIELWQMGSWDLALIVFIASVMVPVTKLIAMMFLLLRTRAVSNKNQRKRTKLFVIVEFIGHWSMLDVFVVVLMAAMADFPGITQINIGPAALSFGGVVILTMLAAMSFDPRRGWDKLRFLKLDKTNYG